MSRLVGFEPNADVFIDEERGAVIVTVEIAGADPESLRVEMDDERQLVIYGRRPRSRHTGAGSFVQKEIAFGDFSKRIHLPVAVECESAGATYGDGVLVITLELSEAAYHPTARTEIRMVIRRTQV